MALPFARSWGALHAERARPTLLILVLSMGLVSAWVAWFFLASMTRSTTGALRGTTRRGTVLVTVAPEAAQEIQRGQTAVLHLHDTRAGQRYTLPGMVMAVTRQAEGVRVEVSLTPQAAARIRWHERITGHVEITVEQLAPAVVLMRTIGRFRG